MSIGGQLDWLLDDLVTRVTHIDQAVVLSRDGLAIGASGGLSREDSEYLAAVAAGSRAWPAARASTSAAGLSGRPSWRWTPRSCS